MHLSAPSFNGDCDRNDPITAIMPKTYFRRTHIFGLNASKPGRQRQAERMSEPAWSDIVREELRIAMPPAIVSKRDPRVDVVRGLALMMIFIDHIPGNVLGLVTLHNFGFSDAAEVFVLLAGFSSMLAYGRIFERDGARSGLRRIALRLARLYLFQVGLLLATLGAVLMWTT